MRKLATATVMFFVLLSLQTNAFAGIINCKFKSEAERVEGISSIILTDETLTLNNEFEIPLEKSRVKCGFAGKKVRFDGNALGYQVVLKACSDQGQLEGHLIDSIKKRIAEVLCK